MPGVNSMTRNLGIACRTGQVDFFMNVIGWRAEPEHVQSDPTSRLLRWMGALSTPAASIEVAAGQVALGFYELLGAHKVAVWARRTELDDLSLLSVLGEGAGVLTSGAGPAEESASMSAPQGALSLAPLWIEDASGPGRDLALGLARASGFSEDDLPSLALALSVPGPQQQSALLGVALVSLDSPDGLLSEGMRPLVEAAQAQGGQYLSAAARAEKLARSFYQLAEAFAGAIDRKDTRRNGHSTAVAYYADLIARSLDLDTEAVETIEFAALIHDLGRISVPDAILQKAEPLTASELESVRSAPTRGAELLSRVNGLEDVAAIVRHQGEKWDGSGTPGGLRGDEIPLGSRIIALATRFAAMTSARADRRPLSVVGGAMEAVVEESGTTLDPKVVEAFLRAMGRSL